MSSRCLITYRSVSGLFQHVSTSSNHQISGLYWRFGYQQAPNYLDNMTRILPTRQHPSEEHVRHHIRTQEIIQPLPWDVLRFTLWNPPTRHGKSWDHDRYFYFINLRKTSPLYPLLDSHSASFGSPGFWNQINHTQSKGIFRPDANQSVRKKFAKWVFPKIVVPPNHPF